MKTIRISPSEIAFLWDNCKRCWYRKCNGMQKPKEAFLQMFNLVDSGMKKGLTAQALRDCFGIPAKALCSFERVLSTPIPFEEQGVQIVISGKVDRAVELEDGSFGLLEFKMSEATPRNVNKYTHQCHAYERALFSPAVGDPREISRIDLIFYQPFEDWCRIKEQEGTILCTPTSGHLIHHPVELDRSRFDALLLEMATIAGSLELPAAGANCDYCNTVAATLVYDANLAALAEKRSA